METRAARTLATTRRGFLALAGATASLAALGQLRALPAAGTASGARFFGDRERGILAHVVARIVDSGDPRAPAVERTGTLDAIDRLCAGLDPDLVAPLPWLLRAVEYGPLLFQARPSRFSRLAPEEQDAALRGWMTSRFALRRQGFQALRNLALLGYYAQPETWPLIGYAGPLLAGGARAGRGAT